MKVHYMNALLFALPLNILAHNKKKQSITTRHTQTNRSLCECELYMPNYDNDPEMKYVMQNFNKQTQQRFEEYDERIQSKRKLCKDQCDKEIQKIILKDKLEKELMDKFSTLQTDIQSDAIPTCVCEKSVADKMEKFCLNCGVNVGGGVMPVFGAIGGTALYTLNLLKPAALKAAKAAALTEAKDLATKAGIDIVRLKIQGLSKIYPANEGYVDLVSIVNKLTYNNRDALIQSAKKVIGDACINPKTGKTTIFYNSVIEYGGKNTFDPIAKAGATAYETTYTSQKGTLEAANLATVNTTYTSCQTAIIASVVAILIIVLIMIIIYLVLRYRRKKKMKRKLQYIKVLEE
ncbi:rifin PIR protein, putative [Plasmodium reichenowi]|uniref:Rifin PIR protein, putative n=1 Tax=Plasmodium reichenowi TaxID=5854 RepID=A0A2P9DSK7_PLARE|nr:rifin PIR protein, putative [Plasmodium reichenowi]